MVKKLSKAQRHSTLLQKVETHPFMTDEELARDLGVSVPTIRLDRMELNIKEHRERVKNIARQNMQKVQSISEGEMVGEIVDIIPGDSAVAFLMTDESMVFSTSQVVRGNHIYSFAETTAVAVIDARVALVGVANIKYKMPVYAGEKLVAYAQVRSVRKNKHVVWVFIKNTGREVFRGKFLLASLPQDAHNRKREGGAE